MKGYIDNIEQRTTENTNFRQVLYTGKHSQLVLMAIGAGEDIGMEMHSDVDQFFRFEEGDGKVIIDGVEHSVTNGTAVIVPAGAQHNVINTGSSPLKLYTVYSPANHKDGTVHATKADALADNEKYDGVSTE